jgi:hypothetical protein
MVFVVVAHYNEDTSWVNNLKYKYKIISKAGIPAEHPPNKGNEASSFLQYIIENYDNLDDITVFVHGHRSDWHHKENIDEKINRIAFDKDYYNINTNDTGNSLTPLTKHHDSLAKMKQMLPQLGNILNIRFEPAKIVYRNSAQFYVKKELIKKHSKETYFKLHAWLMYNNESSYYTGRAFEYTWHIIFTGRHVDVY